jgi:hypothetical protein
MPSNGKPETADILTLALAVVTQLAVWAEMAWVLNG